MIRNPKAQEILKNSQVVDTRGETDTIRLWENYRDQALLWRSMALLQIPTTLIALLFSLVLWHSRETVLNVPREPLPGMYSAHEIPDRKFIEAATEFVNLIATYQPAVARSQFKKAREMLYGGGGTLADSVLNRFDVEMMGSELRAIETTNRVQVFFIDPTKSKVERESKSKVHVTLQGERLKVIAGKELPSASTRFIITMTTLPRNQINPYGIVVSNVQFQSLEKN